MYIHALKPGGDDSVSLHKHVETLGGEMTAQCRAGPRLQRRRRRTTGTHSALGGNMRADRLKRTASARGPAARSASLSPPSPHHSPPLLRPAAENAR